MLDTRQCLKSLSRWLTSAQACWVELPDHSGLGFYGTGYNATAVQTQQKFITVTATLAVMDDRNVEQNLAQCLAALRYCLATHKTGELTLTDGTRWGHTPDSAQGLNPMMSVFGMLDEHLSNDDKTAAQRILTSEADWLIELPELPGSGLPGGQDNHHSSNANTPASNMSQGTFLWRVAQMYPDHQNVLDWQTQASQLIDQATLTTGSDEDHPNALDIDEMVLTLANAAMLHFDLKANDWARPPHLDHNLKNLWQILKKMIFADGRLCHIAGDQHVRYACSEEYLMHVMMLAADLFDDSHALYLCAGRLQALVKEQFTNEDGSYYSGRLTYLKNTNPYDYTQIESDRACAVAAAMRYNPRVQWPAHGESDFESDVAGLWSQPETGTVLHRCPTRIASVSWHDCGLNQALCQPPDDGHFAEWSSNLCSVVKFMGDQTPIDASQPAHCQLEHCHIDTFEGGFATLGRTRQGVKITLNQGWQSVQLATLQQAFIALPDGQTLVGMHHCRTGETRAYPTLIQGMHLNLPNDLYNGYQRTFNTPEDQLTFTTETQKNQVVDLNCNWINIDHRLGVIGIYGAKQLCVDRSVTRRGGSCQSLHVDEICFGYQHGNQGGVAPYSMILDIGFVIGSNINTQDTQQLALKTTHKTDGDLRMIQIMGADGRMYIVCANFGLGTRTITAGSLWPSSIEVINLATDDTTADDNQSVRIPASSAAVYLLDM